MGHHTLFSRFRSNCSRGVASYLFGSGGFCLKKYANIVIIIPQSGSCTWVQVIYWAVCGKVGWVSVVQAGIIQNSSIVIFIHDIYYVVFNRHATLKLCVLQKAVFEWQRAWHWFFCPIYDVQCGVLVKNFGLLRISVVACWKRECQKEILLGLSLKNIFTREHKIHIPLLWAFN